MQFIGDGGFGGCDKMQQMRQSSIDPVCVCVCVCVCVFVC